VKYLDRKYLSFREGKVAAAAARYPDRAVILSASEYLRLGFVGVGASLCAAIFGVLTWTAIARVGALDGRTITFGLLALMAVAVTCRVAASLASGLRRSF
jgi:hypothetical protein